MFSLIVLQYTGIKYYNKYCSDINSVNHYCIIYSFLSRYFMFTFRYLCWSILSFTRTSGQLLRPRTLEPCLMCSVWILTYDVISCVNKRYCRFNDRPSICDSVSFINNIENKTISIWACINCVDSWNAVQYSVFDIL